MEGASGLPTPGPWLPSFVRAAWCAGRTRDRCPAEPSPAGVGVKQRPSPLLESAVDVPEPKFQLGDAVLIYGDTQLPATIADGYYHEGEGRLNVLDEFGLVNEMAIPLFDLMNPGWFYRLDREGGDPLLLPESVLELHPLSALAIPPPPVDNRDRE